MLLLFPNASLTSSFHTPFIFRIDSQLYEGGGDEEGRGEEGGTGAHITPDDLLLPVMAGDIEHEDEMKVSEMEESSGSEK